MKIVIVNINVNESVRKENTLAAIEAFSEGAKVHHEIEIIQVDKNDISFSNPTIDKLIASDMIVFVTPVYWWGMTADIKLLINKCCCLDAQIKEKKMGVLVPGGFPVDATQYEHIKKDFECMASILDCNMLFYKPFYVSGKDESKNNAELVKELTDLGSSL